MMLVSEHGLKFPLYCSFHLQTQMQRLSKLEEEEKNHIETRKRKFFAEILNAVREFQLQIQASLKRRKQRNDGVQVHNSFLNLSCVTKHLYVEEK